MRTMRMRGVSGVAGTALLAFVATGAGCGWLNNELVVGDRSRAPEVAPEQTSGGYLLSTFNPPDGVFDAMAPGAPVRDAPVPPPSIVGVARENWAPVYFSVPVDGTEHWATHRSDPDWTHHTGAQRNEEYPTEFTVIHGRPTFDQNANQAIEGVLAPFYVGLDAVLMVPRLFVDPPWEVMTSPREWYQRAPQPLPRLRPLSAEEAAGVPTADPIPSEAPTDPAAARRAYPEEAPRGPTDPPPNLPQEPSPDDSPAPPAEPEPQR
jgi:hypothetical protein